MPRQGLDREAVIQAAIELVDGEGPEALSLKRLADGLGIKTPSLYNHVKGMDGLMELLAIRGFELQRDALGQAAAGISKDSAIFALCRTYLNFARSHPGLYAITQSQATGGSEEVRARSQEVLDIFRRAFMVYDLPEPALTHVLRTFRSLLYGFAALDQSGAFDSVQVNRDDSFLAAMATMLAGMHKNYNV